MQKKLIFFIFFGLAGLITTILLYLAGPSETLSGRQPLAPLTGKISGTTAPGGLHIMSWNIGYLYKGRDYATGQDQAERKQSDVKAVSDFVLRQKPDILLLQQCSSKNAQDLGCLLDGYEVFFLQADRSSRLSALLHADREHGGISVISRLGSTEVNAEYIAGTAGEKAASAFLLSIRLPSAADGKDWLLVNAGLADGASEAAKKDLAEYVSADTSPESGTATVLAGDFSLYTDQELSSLTERLGPWWTEHRAANAPDGRDLSGTWSRLESGTWNRVLFIVPSSVAVQRIYCHDLKFANTPGNPVSVIVSLQ
ncbi:MAG: endonuclease/exonuclease/phosphatase family protein [Spirochaetales bacterium]|nr:endonuclease/exonuclease/phosphatase family protein [Spirochaetales bacterium]